MIELTAREIEALIGLLNVRLAQIHNHRRPWTLANEREAEMLSKTLDKLELTQSTNTGGTVG